MIFVNREKLTKITLPGRIIQKAVGKDGFLSSNKMTVGFGRYSADVGPMEPHHHAEETIMVLDAKDAYALYGPSKDSLNSRIDMKPGDIFLFEELEWHVFKYDDNGFVDIIFIYGQVDNIRPEEIIKN